jgi:nicotinamidase-related amidase
MITALDKKTALVIIDLQKGILGRETAHPSSGVIANSALLVEAFRKAGLPIVPVNVNPSGAKWLQARVDQPGMPKNAGPMNIPAEFFEIIPDIHTHEGDIFITKKTWSAFFETPMHEELQKHGVTGIVLCGIATSIGVEGTARSASELGYNISFATDAMTDMLMEAHENSIKNIFPRMGEVGTTADIIKELSANN